MDSIYLPYPSLQVLRIPSAGVALSFNRFRYPSLYIVTFVQCVQASYCIQLAILGKIANRPLPRRKIFAVGVNGYPLRLKVISTRFPVRLRDLRLIPVPKDR